MAKNTLINPFIGKIQFPDITHIKKSFSLDNPHQKNCVTSLSMSNGSYIDATSGELPDQYLLKKNLKHDKFPMICTEKVSTEKVINIFNELLQNKTETIDSLQWNKNKLNLGNKKIVFLYVFLFFIFNIVLITMAKKKISEEKMATAKKKIEKKTIQKIKNDYYLINQKTNKKVKINKDLKIEDLFKKEK